MIKLLQTGHALASLEELRKQGLDRGVFPILDAAWAPAGTQPRRETFLRLALEDTDRRVGEGRPVAPSFMIACMLWHDVQERWAALREQGEAPFPALQQAIDAVFDARIGDISGRGKLAADMREIWQMQPRFERRTPASAASLVEQPRFRAGYDFLRLRADVDEVAPELADWWEDFSLGSDEEREALLQDIKRAQARRVPAPKSTDTTVKSSGRTAPARGEATTPDTGGESTEDAAAEGGDTAPRKRRRRRRRGGGSGEGGSASSGPSAEDGKA
jgi:poly(A) polymerase